MCRIISCDHSLDQKDILKFIYWLMIIFLTVYIFKYFFIVSTYSSAIMVSKFNYLLLNYN
jgi:hypothetical protein